MHMHVSYRILCEYKVLGVKVKFKV